MTHPDPLMVNGPDFYDDEEVFNKYRRARMRGDSPNETLEKPVIWELLQDAPIAGARVLDLGCGDGLFVLELLQAGCQHYTGVEGSRRMFALAQETLTNLAGEVVLARLEDWEYPTAHFDIVVSRLALHYIEDLTQLFRRVYQTLAPGGSFVFSVEHPVMTSSNRSRGENGDGLRQDWIVDDYFLTGERDVMWMGQRVVKYHQTVEDYFMLLQDAHFNVTHLRESRPKAHLFRDEALFRRRSRTPLFLFLVARRGSE